MNKKLTARVFFIAIVILAGSFAIVQAANSVLLKGYLIELVEYSIEGNQGTFTYAITADPATFEITDGGLSHWTLGIGTCDQNDIISPPESPPAYTTITDHPSCSNGTYTCLEATYPQVEYGPDGTTGVNNGIKFGDANDEQLSTSNPGTHIFQITLDNVTGVTDVEVGVKASGPQGAIGLITGPTCNTPSAVSLSTVQANQPDGGQDSSMVLFITVTLLTLSGLIGWLRRQRQM